MLSWLKDILGDAYTEAIAHAVAQKIGLCFVARADFNKSNNEKKALQKELTVLRKQLEEYSTQTVNKNIATNEKTCPAHLPERLFIRYKQ